MRLPSLFRLSRPGVVLAGVAMAAAVGLPAGPAQAAPTTDPVEAAAGWLAGQMVDGERFEADFGTGEVFPDQGLTVDAVLAFAAAGVAADHADAALAWLATPDILTGYIGDGVDEAYAGAHAKLLLATDVQGLDPTYGGVDLPAALLSLLDEDGRFSDRSAFGDFSNGFSQSLAVLALGRAAGEAPPEAVDFLLSEQCPDGGFPLLFGEADCASDVDSTALVVQALLVVGELPAAESGLDWLAGVQQPGGGFAGSPPTEVVNANSTGLAVQALRAGGRAEAADQAVAFLLSLQVGCNGPAADRGAVGYDESGFDVGNATRATSQAVLGLAGVSLADLDGTAAQAEPPSLDCGDGTPGPSPTPGEPSPPPAGQGGELPVTGVPLVVLAGLGGLLAATGGLLRWGARTRRRDPGSQHPPG